MKIIKTDINSFFVLKSEPIADDRGYFERLFCMNELNELLNGNTIVQINHSFTKKKGAIRGMHFQKPPEAEIKIVKCLAGSAFDVAVDLRSKSETFLKYHGEVLTPSNGLMMFIPKGFAHGFQTLEENTELLYFHTEFYNKEYESGIRYDDPALKINWKLSVSEISDRDKNFKLIENSFTGLNI